ncbi:hypothetical protein ACGFMK_24520 [Amycolatopsis sp. NPDC049252]|uniref:hypothetical protein n=1 Tax=Amycolatopsis sp. NPDC049252 TaxID=3363933 RepID=UPI003722B721
MASFLAGVVAVAAAGWWVRRRAPSPVARGARRPAVSVRSTVAGSATAELCLVWRRSHEELARLPDEDPARGRLAAIRQVLLDELESREAAGFRRWLDNGAMAGADPLPYLRVEHGLAEPGPPGVA